MASKGSKSEVIPAELPILHGPGFDWDLAQVDEAQVQGLYTRGVEVVLAIILAIVALVRGFQHDNVVLRQRVDELEHQLHQDSHNRSKPPSSDGIRKRKAKPRRQRSGKKPGGQRGHVGTTLRPVDHPDVVMSAPVQYGPGIVARIVYMHCDQLLPIKRIGEWFRDEWQIRLSTGPVMRSIRQVADRVEPIMETVRLALQQDLHTIHADETGMRVRGKLWLVVSCGLE